MMAFIRVIALALALAGSSWSSHPSESARNQYGAREDRIQPQPQLLTEATDHPPEVHTFLQAGLINNSTNGRLTHEKSPEVDKSRSKRSYSPWTGSVVYPVPYQSISVWRSPTYQLQRPYFIPIYGVSGRIPIYYPPQPLYINPGVPKDNPAKRPFRGPTYLPPTTPKMEIEDRFNGGDNSDDRIIWDGDSNTQGGNMRPNQRPTTQVTPTRRPRPPGVPKTPPLIHNPTDPEGFPAENVGFTTSRPSTTSRPPQQAPPAVNEPSRCVWAIISCCSSTNEISYDCFEQRGCPGAFWDTNPCDSDFARAAIAAALNYYNRK